MTASFGVTGKLRVLLGSLALFTITACTQTESLDANALRQRGLAHMQARQYEQALQDFHAAIALGDDASWAFQGDVYYNIGKKELALASFGESISRDPLWMWPYNNRGELYLDRGDYALAMGDFDQAIHLGSNYPMGWNNRCRTEAIIGQLQQAVDDCNHALELKANFVNNMVASGRVAVRQDRGLAYLKMGRFDLALEDYKTAVALLPRSAEAIFGRGIAKHNVGDIEGAKADIAAAKVIDPHIEAVFLSGQVSSANF